MLPEPAAMRSDISKSFGESKRTVFTPSQMGSDGKVRILKKDEFARLGISWESYLERAQAAAERRLAELQPEIKKDAAGHVLYAVYRGDDPSIACLLVAPTLGAIFKNILGDPVWIVSPDRRTLYLFPARKEALEEFAEDLRERFQESAFASSDEVFEASAGKETRVVGTLSGARE